MTLYVPLAIVNTVVTSPRQYDMNIKKLLELFGLRAIEVRVYEELFAGGMQTASVLAKRIGISRTSVYDLLERLIEVGLVAETIRNRTKEFMIQPPEKIQILIEEKEKGLVEAKGIIQDLEQVYGQKRFSIKPRLQLFEGRAELQQMMKDILLYRDITVRAYWPVKKMLALLSPEFMATFHKERVARNIALHVIWPKTQLPALKDNPFLDSSSELKREVRVAPDGIDFSLGYSIYKNTVRFISSSNENFGFLVESTELAEMMQTQFDVLWNISKKLKKRENSVGKTMSILA